MSFQIHALPPVQFESLFTLSKCELAKVQAIRMIVDAKRVDPGNIARSKGRVSASSQCKTGLLCCAGHTSLINEYLTVDSWP